MRRKTSKKTFSDLEAYVYSEQSFQDSQENPLPRKKTKTRSKPSTEQRKPALSQDHEIKPTEDEPDILEIKQPDDTIREHVRPAFLRRWDGESTSLTLTEDELDQMSPMFRVYWECKSQHMNCIVFLQLGKVEFLAFQEDALKLHQIFKKKLKKYSDFLMVNFWVKEVELAKQELFERKIPVLTMNQIDDPQYKKINSILKRQITEVITPSLHLSTDSKNSRERLLLAIYPEGSKSAVLLLDAQANEVYLEQISSQSGHADLRRILNRFRPVQVLIPNKSDRQIRQICRQVCSPYIVDFSLKDRSIPEALREFAAGSTERMFRNMLNLKQSQQGKPDSAFEYYLFVKALDLLYQYLSNLNLAEKVFEQSTFRIENFRRSSRVPFFDSQVYQNLEVFRLQGYDGDAQKGTLLAYIDHCLTMPGKKLLRRWLAEPLKDVEAILARQQAVRELLALDSSLEEFHSYLTPFQKISKQVADVYHWVLRRNQRGRSMQSGDINFQKDYRQEKNPTVMKLREIIRLLKSLLKLEEFFSKINSHQFKSSLLNVQLAEKPIDPNDASLQNGQQNQTLPRLSSLAYEIISFYNYDPNSENVEPAQGINEIFDTEKSQINDLNEQLQFELDKWRQQFQSEKVCFVSVRARNQIQVPKALIKGRKFKELIFSSETSVYERYTTQVTNQLSEELIQKEIALANAYEPFLSMVVNSFCSYKYIWDRYVKAVGTIDALVSLALVSRTMKPRCFPTFRDNGFEIINGHHVGLLQILSHDTIPNDLRFEGEERVMVLTGPNMGGKSTFMRQVCLLAIMAQMGCCVPAISYSSIVFDQIFCRIGASDRMIEGKSTFFVELQETKRILSQASMNSLVIIDELGRGTSTFDGISIAKAVLNEIIDEIGCYTLFSTHYTDIAETIGGPCVKLMKLEHILSDEGLIFTYQVKEGIAEKSFATNVARIVGIDPSIICEAGQQEQWMAAQQLTKRTKVLNFKISQTQ